MGTLYKESKDLII